MKNISENTELGWAHRWSDEDSTTTFYSDHYMHVRKAKGEDIIKKTRYNGKENGFVHNHKLAPSLGQGKKIIFPDGKIAFVDSVHKQWDKGYYEHVLYYTFTKEGHRSHGGFDYKNINSHCPYVKENIEKSKDIRFEDSTLEEKINIIIENRNKLNLSTIIHINKKDAKLIETINVYDYLPLNIYATKNINDIIKEHENNKEPLLLSDGKTDIQHYKHKNITMISIDGVNNEDVEDLLLFHRHYEK